MSATTHMIMVSDEDHNGTIALCWKDSDELNYGCDPEVILSKTHHE